MKATRTVSLGDWAGSSAALPATAMDVLTKLRRVKAGSFIRFGFGNSIVTACQVHLRAAMARPGPRICWDCQEKKKDYYSAERTNDCASQNLMYIDIDSGRP